MRHFYKNTSVRSIKYVKAICLLCRVVASADLSTTKQELYKTQNETLQQGKFQSLTVKGQSYPILKYGLY